MPSLVQAVPGTGTSGTVVNITIAGTAAGNCLIVAIGSGQDTTNPVVSGITLGGTALASAKSQNNNSAVNCEQWFLASIAAGQTSVAVTFTAGTGADINYDVMVMEWSGLTASPVDKTSGANGSGTSFSSGATGTLTQAAEVIIGAVYDEGNNVAAPITGPGAPWTLLTPVSSATIAELLVGYQVVSATTTQTYSGTMTGSLTVYGATIVSYKAAAAGPGGTVQRRATVPLPRRRPGRAVWQHVTGQAFARVPAPAQQPGAAPRRRPARALVRFAPVTTVNAVPAAPVTGTVQSPATLPPARRKPRRAWLRFTPVTTVNATPSGTVQPRATVPVARRRPARAVAHGIAVPGARGHAPAQQYRTPPRRRQARAQVRFTPVRTVNATPVRRLLVSLASQAGTDDYGNTYPVGVQVGSSLDGSQVALIPLAGGADTAAELQFPITDPVLSNMPNVAGNVPGGGTFAALEISGPAISVPGSKDWVQLVLFSNDIADDGARMEFRSVSTTGTATVMGTMNASGWVFEEGMQVNSNLLVNEDLTVDFNTSTQSLTLNGIPITTQATPSIGSLPQDTNSGTTWVSGERAFMNNNWVDVVNQNFVNIVAALQAAGLWD